MEHCFLTQCLKPIEKAAAEKRARLLSLLLSSTQEETHDGLKKLSMSALRSKRAQATTRLCLVSQFAQPC